jgi:hypothetical protein
MEISFPVSDAVAAELKEKISAGQQRAKEFATATATSTTPLLTHSLSDADVEATMIKLVGSFIHNTSASAGPTLKDITSFVTTHVSGTEYGRVALTDALWFWGTQVQCVCMCGSLCLSVAGCGCGDGCGGGLHWYCLVTNIICILYYHRLSPVQRRLRQ